MPLEPRQETVVQVIYKTAEKTFDGPIGGYKTLDGSDDTGNDAALVAAQQPQTQPAPQVQAAPSPQEEATQASASAQFIQPAEPETTPTPEVQFTQPAEPETTPTPEVQSPAVVAETQEQTPTRQTPVIAPPATTQKPEAEPTTTTNAATSDKASSGDTSPTRAATKPGQETDSVASQASSQITGSTPTQDNSISSPSIAVNAASSSTSSTAASVSSQSDGMSGGAKAGLAIGILLAIGLLLGLIFFCYRRKKKQQREAYQVADDDEKSMARDVNNGATVGRAASTRTTSTAPRLSLRPVTQFLPDLAGKRKSGNALANAGGRNLAPADAMNEKKAAQMQSSHPANPFGDHAENSEKTMAPREERAMVPNQANDPTNPFGNHAEALEKPANADRSLPTDAPVPAPLRIRTPTPEGSSHAAGVAGAAGAALVAAGVAGHKANAPAPLNMTPNRAASPGPMPSPAGTEFSMSSATPASMANGPPPSNVHRVQLDFKPSMDDELGLRAGQLVRLLHEYDDGWLSLARIPTAAALALEDLHLRRSMSPGPYGGGPQRPNMPPPGRKRRSNSASEFRERRASPPGPSPMNPNAQNILSSVQKVPLQLQAITAPDQPPPTAAPPPSSMPSRKPVPGQAISAGEDSGAGEMDVSGESHFAASRNANTQPTYDFLSGGGGASPLKAQPLHQSFRQSTMGKPDLANENLRAQLKSLQYEVNSLKSEREFERLRHEQALQDVQERAEADFKKAQASESSKNISSHKYEAMVRQMKEAQDQATNHQVSLEKKVRILQEQNQSLKEDVDEGEAAVATLDRQYKHQLHDIESKQSTLQKTLSDLRADLDMKSSALQHTQERLSKKEFEAGHLESENLRLKAQAGDSETLAVIKRELSDQVAHIRRLETTNREQSAELKQFRRVYKAVEIVEEEKRDLQDKLGLMEDLRTELREAQLRRQILEDERQSWTSYLQGFQEADYDSPEAVARALMKERAETASLVERLGRIQPELSEKDYIIKNLEEERSKCEAELEKLRSSGGAGDFRVRARLERQRALAVKEVDYLRDQLRTFDSEEQTYTSNQFDAQKSKRIQDLESLVDQYRQELQSLNESFSQLESQVQQQQQQPLLSSPRKRHHDSDGQDTDLLGQLSRKNRTLQDTLSTLQTTNAQLSADLSATRTQLSSLQKESRTRILALRANPTSTYLSMRQSEIDSLRAENKALLAQFVPSTHPDSSSPPTDPIQTVPVHSLNNARAELRALETALADKEKRMLRLKQIWSLKSLEFREAVASLLGWRMDFLPNG
ncbi:MAG: hypothetical protein Q9210_005998, partial [Variospora velana]